MAYRNRNSTDWHIRFRCPTIATKWNDLEHKAPRETRELLKLEALGELTCRQALRPTLVVLYS